MIHDANSIFIEKIRRQLARRRYVGWLSVLIAAMAMIMLPWLWSLYEAVKADAIYLLVEIDQDAETLKKIGEMIYVLGVKVALAVFGCITTAITCTSVSLNELFGRRAERMLVDLYDKNQYISSKADNLSSSMKTLE